MRHIWNQHVGAYRRRASGGRWIRVLLGGTSYGITMMILGELAICTMVNLGRLIMVVGDTTWGLFNATIRDDELGTFIDGVASYILFFVNDVEGSDNGLWKPLTILL